MSTLAPSPLLAARPSFLYRIALAAVAVTMAALPVVYVALTALTSWGVYLFATRYFASIWEVPGFSQSAVLIKVLFSCTPLAVGSTVALTRPTFPSHRES